MNETKICIYCLGEYGIQTYYKLKEAGIQINYFGDRDKQKQGYVFDGLYCLSYEQVSALDKITTILIVAVKKPDGLIDDFKRMGFVHVYTKEQGIARLCNGKEFNKKPMDQIEEIRQIKELLTDCFYNKKMSCGNCHINKDCADMMSDFLKRNTD